MTVQTDVRPAAGIAPPPLCTRCERHAESTFKVQGLDCHEEVTLLERRLRPMKGVEDLSADVMGQRLRVSYDAALLSAGAIAQAVSETGMRAWLEHEQPVAASSSDRRARLLGLAAATLLIGWAAEVAGAPRAVAITAYVVTVALGGIHPARKAATALRQRQLDINTLMVLAVIGAGFLGEWAEAGTVVFLFAIAQWLESRTMRRAREAIRGLIDLTPAEALVRTAAGEQRLPVDAVTLGATMVVKPGEKIALDGIVVAGRSEVNQAPITGESLPVDKAIGDEVFAGTINGHGTLDVRVTRHAHDTTLARIVHLVEAAQSRRAPTQQFVDRFAAWYTPAVITLAVLAATLPPLLLAAPVEPWLYRALVLLVVACPCALVISTPVSIVAAIAGAARQGVLIKGGAHLETLANVRAVAFDKTGTLTRGVLRVARVQPLAGISEIDLLAFAGAVEAGAEHPVAVAIAALARERTALVRAANVRAWPGLGAEGTVGGRLITCGSPRLFTDRDWLTPEASAAATAMVAEGMSVVLVARETTVIGAIGLADEIRTAAPDIVDLLHEQGVRTVAMFTGDQEAAAHRVAAAVRVDDVRAGLLPAEKVAAVETLRATNGVVAMVGDGINDAPALAAADVGVAMGTIGSAAALETADIALMTDELAKVPYAIRLSRATVRNIKVNVALSLAMKAAFVLAAVLGVATLWMAVVADTGASVLVIGNAVRLLRYR